MLDVFIGFMDEEVFYTLSTILDNSRLGTEGSYGGVYVIERGRVESYGQLFQRPLSAYGPTPIDFINPALINHAQPDPALKTLSSNMRRIFDEDFTDAHLRERGTGGDPKLPIDAPEFTLVAFGTVEQRQLAKRRAVLIRAPEMGKEPSLFRPYLRALIKSVNGIDPDPISLFTIGAGGSTSPNDTPGAAHVISSSIYVGPSIVLNEVFSVASFVTQDFTGEIYRRVIGKVGDEKVIERAVEDGQREALRFKDEGDPSRSALQRYIAAIPEDLTGAGRRTSLTTGFFSGAAEKKAAESLGLRDVNMEDFHILRIANSLRSYTHGRKFSLDYPKIATTAVIRVDCDPFDIDDKDVDELNAWLAKGDNTTLSIPDLVAVIEFGLAGLPLDDVPSVMRWTFPAELRKNRYPSVDASLFFASRFLRYGGKDDNPAIFDPFRLEMASDLLLDAKEGKAFVGDLTEPTDAALKKVLSTLSGLIRSSSGSAPTDAIELLSEDYETGIDLLRGAMEQSANGRRRMIEALVTLLWQRIESKAGDRKPIWIRRGKWPLQKGASNQQTLPQLRLAKAGVDRAYYKASNLPGLRTLNQTVFTGSIETYLGGAL